MENNAHAMEAAHRRLYVSLGGDSSARIWRWNDALGRTKEEVIAKLREVALS
jgi:hypothetical protein